MTLRLQATADICDHMREHRVSTYFATWNQDPLFTPQVYAAGLRTPTGRPTDQLARQWDGAFCNAQLTSTVWDGGGEGEGPASFATKITTTREAGIFPEVCTGPPRESLFAHLGH
uniref:Uncharacterized protein n=1 Tax=Anopheles coluzzii TaxID=1518534 RepID=A0A8W7Q1F4_ANOCL